MNVVPNVSVLITAFTLIDGLATVEDMLNFNMAFFPFFFYVATFSTFNVTVPMIITIIRSIGN